MKRVLFVLGQLNDHDIEWLIDHGIKYNIDQGKRLVEQGETSHNMYIILDGHFSIINENDPSFEIARIGAGEIVGEMSLLDARPPSVSVKAKTDSNVYAISFLKIRQRMETDTAFAARLYHSIGLFLSNRLRKTTARLGYGNPQEDFDEINLKVLEEVSQAGARFNRILNKFSEV